ncbi:hypothetical protein [Thermofilum sp.]
MNSLAATGVTAGVIAGTFLVEGTLLELRYFPQTACLVLLNYP